jgi:hypothetical protein
MWPSIKPWQKWIVALIGLGIFLLGLHLLDEINSTVDRLCDSSCGAVNVQTDLLLFYVILATGGACGAAAWIFRAQNSKE